MDQDKGVITTTTPDGDKIIYGEAFDSEQEASHRGGRKGADLDAMRLYARLAEYFPQSPLAAEAAYRAPTFAGRSRRPMRHHAPFGEDARSRNCITRSMKTT